MRAHTEPDFSVSEAKSSETKTDWQPNVYGSQVEFNFGNWASTATAPIKLSRRRACKNATAIFFFCALRSFTNFDPHVSTLSSISMSCPNTIFHEYFKTRFTAHDWDSERGAPSGSDAYYSAFVARGTFLSDNTISCVYRYQFIALCDCGTVHCIMRFGVNLTLFW